MSHVPPDEAAAAQAGADIELPAGQPPPELPREDFDGAAVDAVRVALPTWDVRPEELTRTVTSATPRGTAGRGTKNRGATGRVPDLSGHGQQVA